MDQDNLKKREEEFSEKFKDQPIELVPFYHDLKNEIIEPEKLVVGTQYFWKKWSPRLGPTLTVLIVRLRMHCYYNKLTKEKRDWCYPTQEQLATELGVSWRTIHRELQREETNLFITREPQYVYIDKLKKITRRPDKYIVSMDDPLLPADTEKLIEKSIDKLLNNPVPDKLSGTPVDNCPESDNLSGILYDCQIVSANNVNTNVITNNVNNVAQSAKNVFNDKDPLVEDIINYLGDKKSLGFYRKIAKTCPAQLVYRALGETKEAAVSKRIKTTKGAYFTDLIKRLAIEQGVNLKLKDK